MLTEGVTGLLGIFLADTQGTLIAHKMPSRIQVSDLVLAAAQASQLLQVGDCGSTDSTLAIVTFGACELRILRFARGCVCALSLSTIDSTALAGAMRKAASGLPQLKVS